MAGVILENISTKKLVAICFFLLGLSLASFIIGGSKVPQAVHAQTVGGTWCVSYGKNLDGWYPLRDPNVCLEKTKMESAAQNKVRAEDIVFSFQYPLRRDNQNLKMSKWFMYHTTVLSFHILYREGNELEYPAKVNMSVAVAYRDGSKGNKSSNWVLYFNSTVNRKLICTDPMQKADGYQYDCDFMDLFEVGNMQHEEYLINIRLPPDNSTGSNMKLGEIDGIDLVWFAQTGGFTLYLWVLKTVCFAMLLPLTIWNWKRVVDLNRSPVFLEKLLLAVALSALLLNFPVDWLMLVIELKFMLLWSDIRQGIFLTILLAYWLVFTGEHMMDDVKRGGWSSYWKELAVVILASSLMLIFDMCERGIKIVNPFFSLWSTREGETLGKAFIGVAMAAGIIYFLMLLVYIAKAIYNIWTKRRQFKSMAKGLRIHYMSIIYRFFFALLFSGVCCMLTVVAFTMGQVYESQWKWNLDEYEEDGYVKYFEVNSAFQMGVYATWNVYVMAMLIFYAPSHKLPLVSVSVIGEENEENDEQVELTRLDSDVGPRSRTYAASSIEQSDEYGDESVRLTTGRSVITEGVSQMHTLSNRPIVD